MALVYIQYSILHTYYDNTKNRRRINKRIEINFNVQRERERENNREKYAIKQIKPLIIIIGSVFLLVFLFRSLFSHWQNYQLLLFFFQTMSTNAKHSRSHGVALENAGMAERQEKTRCNSTQKALMNIFSTHRKVSIRSQQS